MVLCHKNPFLIHVFKLVEVRRIELLSENISTQVSPSAGYGQDFL